jgi:hypothetical protein
MKAIQEPPKLPEASEVETKSRVLYPADYVTDPTERRRMARELRGSIPDIMTHEEFREMRRKS